MKRGGGEGGTMNVHTCIRKSQIWHHLGNNPTLKAKCGTKEGKNVNTSNVKSQISCTILVEKNEK